MNLEHREEWQQAEMRRLSAQYAVAFAKLASSKDIIERLASQAYQDTHAINAASPVWSELDDLTKAAFIASAGAIIEAMRDGYRATFSTCPL